MILDKDFLYANQVLSKILSLTFKIKLAFKVVYPKFGKLTVQEMQYNKTYCH